MIDCRISRISEGGDLYGACKWEKNVVSSKKYILRKAEKDV